MGLIEKLSKIQTLFIDTAPLIYFIEGHTDFGPPIKEIFTYFQSGGFEIYTSVITLTEVLPKSVLGNPKLEGKFLQLLKTKRQFGLLEITRDVAIRAGELRGQYPFLKSMDAIQLAAAISVAANVFLTNDKRLKQVKEIPVWTMDDLVE
jgi:predicted nucleic acid-binding protein